MAVQDIPTDAPLRRDGGVGLGHASLDLGSTPDGIHNTGKFRQEPVAGVLYDPAPVLGDLGIDQLAEVRLEVFVGAFFVRAHQARVPGHVGGEDRGEAADRGHDLSSGRLALPSLTGNPRRP